MLPVLDFGSVVHELSTHLSDTFAGLAMMISAAALGITWSSARQAKRSADASTQSACEARRSNDLQQMRDLVERVQPYNVRVEVYRGGRDEFGNTVSDHDGHPVTDHVGFTISNNTPYPIRAPHVAGWIMNGSAQVHPVDGGIDLSQTLPPKERVTFFVDPVADTVNWPRAYTDRDRYRADEPTKFHLVWDELSFIDGSGDTWTRPREGQARREETPEQT